MITFLEEEERKGRGDDVYTSRVVEGCLYSLEGDDVGGSGWVDHFDLYFLIRTKAPMCFVLH